MFKLAERRGHTDGRKHRCWPGQRGYIAPSLDPEAKQVTSKPWFHLLLVVTALAFSCGELEGHELIYCLSFQKLYLSPNERLSKFDLHIKSGIIVGVMRVPAGWQLKIDNESKGMPAVSGVAIEQAADLEEREFAPGFILAAGVAKDLLSSGLSGKMSVEGYFELSEGDTKRVLPVSDTNVTMTPASRCGCKR